VREKADRENRERERTTRQCWVHWSKLGTQSLENEYIEELQEREREAIETDIRLLCSAKTDTVVDRSEKNCAVILARDKETNGWQ